MAEKNIKSRIVHKHDVESNWLLATGFSPKQGEIIVYDIDDNYNYERIKIGDGITNVNELPFADDALRAELFEQIGAINDKVDAVSVLVGDTAVSDQINEALLNNQSDWEQTDETAPDFIKNKPDEDDALELIAEMGVVEPVAASDGSIYTDKNGVIYAL